ncbi:enoyl-CoA hydratase/isomerase family protein [Candidatus Woesearchaeota archaeon]|nr:enoyl-CoA hydratase/isomerase family protein [Candidatus Woesearchaeota archaeon]
MSSKILFQGKGNIATITLNNPAKLNALDKDMIKELDDTLEKIRKSNIRVVIIKGAGTSFCSGGDILWERKLCDINAEIAKKEMKFLQDVFAKIEELPQIFIAFMHGHVAGGGNELAMACDIRVAVDTVKISQPENTLGTVPAVGGTKRLARLIGIGKAKYMLFTGNIIDGKTALQWGLTDFLVFEKQVKTFLDSLASSIAEKPKKALELTKKSISENCHSELKDEFELNSYIECSRSKENKAMFDKFLNRKKN